MNNVRELKTRQEIDYLEPIFDEVYQTAKEQNPKLSRNIQVYITDAMYVNAFACGKNTVCITKGALETFNTDELAGVIAHELGHICYGHTKATLLSLVGNAFFSLIVWIFGLIIRISDTIGTAVTSQSMPALLALKVFTVSATLLYNGSLFLFVYISNVILSLNSRTNEFQADDFSDQIGYGEELTQALYLIDKISMGQKLTLKERIMASHPHTAERIKRLEQKQETELVL
jgi:heat shock protein HtpX